MLLLTVSTTFAFCHQYDAYFEVATLTAVALTVSGTIMCSCGCADALMILIVIVCAVCMHMHESPVLDCHFKMEFSQGYGSLRLDYGRGFRPTKRASYCDCSVNRKQHLKDPEKTGSPCSNLFSNTLP